MPPVIEVFLTFLRLGLTSFGGPVAHIGYFRSEVVDRRGWLDDARFAELLALCQFLPGPASSQLGFALGYQRAGLAGALAAFVAFTAPSAIVLIALAAGMGSTPTGLWGGVFTGLKITAVAVVAHALWGMARSLAPDGPRAALALLALAIVALSPWPALAQVGAIVAGGTLGLMLLPASAALAAGRLPAPSRTVGAVCLLVFAALLITLPILAGTHPLAQIADTFYRAGALVFGGGHVVLPLLESGTVGAGLVTPDSFLAGYGAAQAVPGPLFTFAGYLGQEAGGLPAALIGLAAVFLPGFLLLMGALPFWSELSARPAARQAMAGANAAVVGILAAAFYDPVFTAGIRSTADFALAATLFLLLTLWKRPALQVVALGAAGGVALTLAGL